MTADIEDSYSSAIKILSFGQYLKKIFRNKVCEETEDVFG